MVFFPNVTARLYEYNESEEIDIRGEKKFDYIFMNEYPANFEPKIDTSNTVNYGKIIGDEFTLFLNRSVSITDTMIVKINDNFFSIEGFPNFYNHGLINHIEVSLKFLRKHIKVKEEE